MTRAIWLALLVTGAMLAQSATAKAQLPTITMTTQAPVAQPPMNTTAAFVATGSYNIGGAVKFGKVVIQVRSTKADGTDETFSPPKDATSSGGAMGTYNGQIVWDYTATRKYDMKAWLYDEDGVAVKETTWQPVN